LRAFCAPMRATWSCDAISEAFAMTDSILHYLSISGPYVFPSHRNIGGTDGPVT
jgi:hypothetical protein